MKDSVTAEESQEARATTIELTYVHPVRVGKLLALLAVFLMVPVVPVMYVSPVSQGANADGVKTAIITFMFVFYQAIGFVMGLVMAWLYNSAVGLGGGLRIDCK